MINLTNWIAKKIWFKSSIKTFNHSTKKLIMICYKPSPWSKRIKNTFKLLVKITKTSINKKNKLKLRHSLWRSKTKNYKKSLPLFKLNMIKLSKLTNKNIANFLSLERKRSKKVKYSNKMNKKYKNFKKHVKEQKTKRKKSKKKWKSKDKSLSNLKRFYKKNKLN